MKKIFETALSNVLTTLMGCVAGVPEIKSGIEAHDQNQIIVGIGLLLLGIFAKDGHKSE